MTGSDRHRGGGVDRGRSESEGAGENAGQTLAGLDIEKMLSAFLGAVKVKTGRDFLELRKVDYAGAWQAASTISPGLAIYFSEDFILRKAQASPERLQKQGTLEREKERRIPCGV